MNISISIHQAWIIMIALTLSTFALGQWMSIGIVINTLLIITALIKGQLIINEFMELKEVSFLWRAIMLGWLWFVCISLLIIILIS